MKLAYRHEMAKGLLAKHFPPALLHMHFAYATRLQIMVGRISVRSRLSGVAGGGELVGVVTVGDDS